MRRHDEGRDELQRISNKILYNISQCIKVKIIPPPLPLSQIPTRIVCACLLCMHTDQPASFERISDAMTKQLVYSTYKADLTPSKRRDVQNDKEKIALDDRNKNKKKESGEISKHERRSHASKKLKRRIAKASCLMCCVVIREIFSFLSLPPGIDSSTHFLLSPPRCNKSKNKRGLRQASAAPTLSFPLLSSSSRSCTRLH